VKNSGTVWRGRAQIGEDAASRVRLSQNWWSGPRGHTQTSQVPDPIWIVGETTLPAGRGWSSVIVMCADVRRGAFGKEAQEGEA
jgi:hypothetical protein